MNAIPAHPVREVVLVILQRVVVIDEKVVIRLGIALKPSVDSDNLGFLPGGPDGL
jgi:hypothetical protein